MKNLPAVGLLCTMAGATIAAVAAWPDAGHVRTDDRNGDGRPDVWRRYDAQGQPTEIDIDTNFDGRSDVQEYYERGELVRRESDRDFNDQIDLVEDFDATTHERVRTTIDLDYDGSADLLILFQNGRPAFSKRASEPAAGSKRPGRRVASSTARARQNDDKLARLFDPFRGDTAARAAHVAPIYPAVVGLVCADGLPAASMTVAPALAAARFAGRDIALRALADLYFQSPRGPPAS